MEQNLDEYDGLYIPGGHGAMVDFPDNAKLQQVIATMFSKGASNAQLEAVLQCAGLSSYQCGTTCLLLCFI